MQEMEKLVGIQRQPSPTPAGRMAAYMECVRTLPPSQVPSFRCAVAAQGRHAVPGDRCTSPRCAMKTGRLRGPGGGGHGPEQRRCAQEQA